MRSKQSNISNNHWDSSLEILNSSKKPSANILKLINGGVQTLKDLVWIFPLRIIDNPEISTFAELETGTLFKGKGTIVNIKKAPAYGRKGKGSIQLFNITVIVKDLYSHRFLTLKWFNTYPNIYKKIDSLTELEFLGEVQEFNGTLQIINPKLDPSQTIQDEYLIEYPTVHTVSGKFIKSLIQKIKPEFWDYYPSIVIHNEHEIENIASSFQILHGLVKSTPPEIAQAQNRLIYEEFYTDHLKIMARRVFQKKKDAPSINISETKLYEIKSYFPYRLTTDQEKSLTDILKDLNSGHPMMRMLQGDVGCGKTSIALIAAIITAQNNMQVAIMCPTEALALQHGNTFSEFCQRFNITIALLLGSTKPKEKKIIYDKLKNGEIQIIIGTHSLFQDSVEFHRLGLAIIDEQHKFGVNQRQKLVSKGNGAHCLIMTATPIPRTLQLAQYGDLDISSIRTMPEGRKGIKTRIVKSEQYDKYLSFVKTRISLGEQAYIVVPAINESEILNINNVTELIVKYKKYFPEYQIEALHGELKPEEKNTVLKQFNNGQINILISTSVIEVGINVINATVMSIYNPERFGLSSLHQLRGRVGRGDKSGFCFLVTDKNTSLMAIERLGIIEKSTDGFEIAEADLTNRGEGDLFGVNQSGNITTKKLANLYKHMPLFEQAHKDLHKVLENDPQLLTPALNLIAEDKKIISTI
jgi:ATP-dependent DNA helicase RecG